MCRLLWVRLSRWLVLVLVLLNAPQCLLRLLGCGECCKCRCGCGGNPSLIRALGESGEG